VIYGKNMQGTDFLTQSTKMQGFDWMLGETNKIRKRDSEDFQPMSEAAGAANSDEGVTSAGGRWKGDNLSIGAINHYGHNTMDILFSGISIAKKIDKEFSLDLSGQYTHQQDVGAALLGKIDTNLFGVSATTEYKGALASVAWSNTSGTGSIRSPWGGHSNYASLMLSDFDRAHEQAWLLSLAYDLSKIGYTGWLASTKYAIGNTPDQGSKASPDQQEVDVGLHYGVKSGGWKNLTVRFRLGWNDQTNSVAEKDRGFARFIVDYPLPLL